MRSVEKTLLSVGLCLVLLSALGAILQPAAARDVTIAVVRDGPVAAGDIVPEIRAELEKLVDPSVTVSFKETSEFNAEWNPSRVRQVIVNALRDPEVDYLLVTGLLGAQDAGSEDLVLTKPVVIGTAQFVGMFGTAFARYGPLQKQNLSATFIPHGIAKDVREFEAFVGFQSALAVIDPVYAENLDIIRLGFPVLADTLGIKLSILPVADDPSAALDAVEPGAEAALLGETPRLSEEGRRALIEGLTSRGVVAYSLKGPRDVEDGALVTFLPDIAPIVARRLAINFNQLIRGAPVSDLQTMLPIESTVLVNGRTAAAVGFAPTFEQRIWMEFLHGDALETPETPLTFAEALLEAEKGNTSLTIKDANVSTVLQEKQLARSPLLPQLGASGEYNTREPGPLTGILPDQSGIAGVSLSQMIYDDRAVSDYRSAKRAYEGAQYDRETTRLDVLAAAGAAYLQFVLARVSYRIDVANLDLTRENLELAKVRYEAGYSGQDEVFRWEAELAGRRSDLFNRNAQVEDRRIAFNQVLGIDQEKRWQPEEIEVNPDVFYFLDGRVDNVLDNARTLGRFREFMVTFAMENSPELMAVAKAIEAEGIQLGQRKRAFILPSFSAMLDYNYYYHKRPDFASEVDRATYGLRIMATYPIFNGAARLYDKRRSQTIVQGLSYEKELIRQLVERDTRTAFRLMENSFATIKFARTGAESSNKNLVIVQDKYSQGIVNVTDLLQAQTSAFAAEQAAAGAVYTFLIDLVNLERAISWFEDEKTDEEKNELVERIQLDVLSP